MPPTQATTATHRCDGLIAMVPILRRLVYADDRLSHAIRPTGLDPELRQKLRAERECARIDVAAKLIAHGWTPPDDTPAA